MTIWEDHALVTSRDEDQALAKALGVRDRAAIAKANKIEVAARMAKAAQEEATRRAIARAAQEEAKRTAIARAAQAAQEEAKQTAIAREAQAAQEEAKQTAIAREAKQTAQVTQAKQEEADRTAKEESERLEKEQAKAKQEEADRTAKERDKLAAKKEADRTAKERAAKEEADHQLEDLAVVISTSSDTSSSLPESYVSRAARAQDILHARRGLARPPRGDFLPPEAIACGQPKRGNDIDSTTTEEASSAMVVDGDPPVIHDPKRVRLQSQAEILDSIKDEDL
jgi:hypothetical protein